MSDCILSTGYIDRDGYGRRAIPGRPSALAHRVAYEAARGPIPDGMEIDHLCRVRACVNPDHLEVVTRAENTRRAAGWRRSRTACVHGHEFTPANTHRRPDGGRWCRVCASRYSAEYRKRRTV